MAEVAESAGSTHPNPASESDRCALACWCMILFCAEIVMTLTKERTPFGDGAPFAIAFLAVHALLSAFVTISTLKEGDILVLPGGSKLWPTLKAWKAGVAEKCPSWTTPRRICFVSFWLTPVIANGRTQVPLDPFVSCMWIIMAFGGGLRSFVDIILWLSKLCCKSRVKKD
mmetsp:Transcript_29350/g.93599  ORF Transcript_29350/g.93599 Transcript_29350/m.93599 type:complete len:171 (-) Transcript_29350:175-687(-)